MCQAEVGLKPQVKLATTITDSWVFCSYTILHRAAMAGMEALPTKEQQTKSALRDVMEEIRGAFACLETSTGTAQGAAEAEMDRLEGAARHSFSIVQCCTCAHILLCGTETLLFLYMSKKCCSIVPLVSLQLPALPTTAL